MHICTTVTSSVLLEAARTSDTSPKSSTRFCLSFFVFARRLPDESLCTPCHTGSADDVLLLPPSAASDGCVEAPASPPSSSNDISWPSRR